jgi:hypothetical protein
VHHRAELADLLSERKAVKQGLPLSDTGPRPVPVRAAHSPSNGKGRVEAPAILEDWGSMLPAKVSFNSLPLE